MNQHKITKDGAPLESVEIIRHQDGNDFKMLDFVAIEEPLQIIINEKPSTITMRTPGDDVALALGFLFTEGLIQSKNDIRNAVSIEPNTVSIVTTDTGFTAQKMERSFYSTSSCGVCGKTSIDQIAAKSKYLNFNRSVKVQDEILLTLQEELLKVQSAFEMTGGLHACALFNSDGNCLQHFEDVGRHNALDKLIGHALMDDLLPLDQYILLLSGRASFELIQKASMAGIQIVVAVGAPSSLAISLAATNNITLVGFLKKTGFNIYTCADRILCKT